ncbi:MAG: ATP-binding cassette domain-containing protein [Deltaproteobacteria bacterium]|nr:ATP-binding cassette domain-containing protein [Deltaproteobacteria bacterium]
MTTSPLLQIEGLSKSFFMHDQQKEIPSAREVSFRVHSKRLTALVGPTGAGKSSILKAIYRTYIPCKGRILYRSAAGKTVDLASADEHTILALRSREIGFVTQFLFALPRQPAIDVVASPLYRRGLSKADGRQKAGALLQRLHIPEHLWGLSPTTFSGGERQRINLARGIIGRPRLLLLDEPTASLDLRTTGDVLEMITELKNEGTGILAIFHDPDLVQRMADAVYQLDRP